MFHSARIQLTAWYLLIILVISLVFSLFLYAAVTSEFRRFERFQELHEELGEQGIPVPPFPGRARLRLTPEVIAEAKARVAMRLALLNAGILILAGGAGYFLAGRTLRPIRDMVYEQNRFVTDASHELRTPLASLKSEMEVTLRDTKLTLAGAKKTIGSNLEEVNNLQTLADGLIRLTQYPMRNTVVREPVALGKALEEAERKVSGLAKTHGITIQTAVGAVTAMGEKSQLVELFVILLDNAIKYSPRGTAVKVTARKTDGHIRILVADEGIGIPEADLPHIFDRFYRGDKSRTKTDTPGYGLGLSIAKHIVTSLNGTITASSQKTKGTTITIVLPAV